MCAYKQPVDTRAFCHCAYMYLTYAPHIANGILHTYRKLSQLQTVCVCYINISRRVSAFSRKDQDNHMTTAQQRQAARQQRQRRVND